MDDQVYFLSPNFVYNCIYDKFGNLLWYINDDYAGIIQKIIAADQLWVISDTALGFLNHKGKNVFDRILPILCIYLEFRGDQMRHILRYDKRTDIGIIYQGDANRNYLRQWLDRCTDNLDSKSLGAYPVAELKEAAKCMH